jgi:hypothetical protein
MVAPEHGSPSQLEYSGQTKRKKDRDRAHAMRSEAFLHPWNFATSMHKWQGFIGLAILLARTVQ